MKLKAEFRDFLNNSVNLNQTRIDTLTQRVETIKGFLTGSDYGATIIRFAEQGSWAHKTIIKPPTVSNEFDADLVVYVGPKPGWETKDYVLDLRRVFRASATYKDKTSMKSRCVTIDYAGDFHLDVVPIVDRGGWFEVCNRQTNTFERTDGDGFANWWRDKDKIVGSERLIETARLLKYLRDIKKTFSVKSILLVTLIGERIGILDELVDSGQFDDLPTTLKTVAGRLDDWLQARPALPNVVNPAMPSESFTRHWDQEKYDNFRNKMHSYREWIDDAYDERDRDESIRKWRRVFGDAFAKYETIDKGASAVATLAERFLPGKDLADTVLTLGRRVLDLVPASLPHMEAPKYKYSQRQIPIRVVADEKQSRDSAALRRLSSGDAIRKDSGIVFQATQTNGLPFPANDYSVMWQVVNTDREAANAGDLRGEFTRLSTRHDHFESTRYRGVHWVQAFLVGKRTNRIDGASERYFVIVA